MANFFNSELQITVSCQKGHSQRAVCGKASRGNLGPCALSPALKTEAERALPSSLSPKGQDLILCSFVDFLFSIVT